MLDGHLDQVRKAFCKVLCLPQADCGPWGAASWGGSAQTLGEVIIWHPDTHCSDHCLDSHHNHMIIRPRLQLMIKDDINSSFSGSPEKEEESSPSTSCGITSCDRFDQNLIFFLISGVLLIRINDIPNSWISLQICIIFILLLQWGQWDQWAQQSQETSSNMQWGVKTCTAG